MNSSSLCNSTQISIRKNLNWQSNHLRHICDHRLEGNFIRSLSHFLPKLSATSSVSFLEKNVYHEFPLSFIFFYVFLNTCCYALLLFFSSCFPCDLKSVSIVIVLGFFVLCLIPNWSLTNSKSSFFSSLFLPNWYHILQHYSNPQILGELGEFLDANEGEYVAF